MIAIKSIIFALASLGGLGLIFGAVLAYASIRFVLKVDPKLEAILEVLPQANCGACGFVSCHNFAEALVKGEASVDSCAQGGQEVARKIAQILGVEVGVKEPMVAKILCYHRGQSRTKFIYYGLATCRAAVLVFGGDKACRYSCLGIGSCIEACPFGAISLVKGKIEIDEDICTGCGRCVEACPTGVIKLVPKGRAAYILCNSKDKGKVVRKFCERGCIGCNVCMKACEAEAIRLENNLARIDYEKCNDCGVCAEKCPTKAIEVKESVPILSGR